MRGVQNYAEVVLLLRANDQLVMGILARPTKRELPGPSCGAISPMAELREIICIAIMSRLYLHGWIAHHLIALCYQRLSRFCVA